MRDNSSVIFTMKLYMLLTKAAHQKENFQTCTARIKIHQIAHVFKLCVTLQWEIGLLYFFSWNFTWFLQMEPTKVQNVRLSTAQVKFHQIRTLIGLFYWMYIKSQLNVWKSCFMTPKSGAKFEEKLIFCFKNDKNLVNFDLSTKKSKKFALWLVPFVQSIQRLT